MFGLNEKGGDVCIFIRDCRSAKVADNWTQQMAATLLYDIRANSAVGHPYSQKI
jgi:hypothetical protein